MFCGKCGKELNENVLVCPYCDTATGGDQQSNVPSFTDSNSGFSSAAKPPKKKKKGLVIGIVAGILLMFFLLIVFSDTESLENVSFDNVSTSESAETEEQTVTETDETVTEEPAVTTTEATTAPAVTEVATTQKKVTVDPYVEEFYDALQEQEDYTLTDASRAFLRQKSYLFPCAEEYVDELICLAEYKPYTHLEKSIGKYAQTIVCIENVKVTDIQETGEYTYIHVRDDNRNNYIGYVIGELPTVFDGDEVILYGLPLDIVFFSNLGGGTTKAVCLAVSYCTLIGGDTRIYDEEKDIVWDYGNNVGDYVADDPISYYISVHERSLGYNDLPYSYNADVGAGYVLNIRSSWSTDSAILTTVPHGTLLEWYGTYQGWAYVVSTIDNVGGWVREDLIHPTDDFYYY